ncbi:MAG: RlmE family RNA methyltransferase [Candidatus Nezhaarchaeota archaeon]|nr:RlmE family RNA methyltransferase [Candidatus Nezhaarchaeota archaeon]
MSRRWRLQRARDPHYKRARESGLRSRASFKLIEIIERFRVVKKGDKVLDLGAYPGGWLQVAASKVGRAGLVIGVDIRPIKPLPMSNVITIVGDVCDENTHEKITSAAKGRVDVVLSDLSPKLTGAWPTDVARHISLVECVISIVLKALKDGGATVIKAFQAEDLRILVLKLKELFRDVKLFKPKASKPQSREIYVICRGFHGSAPKNAKD